MEATRLAGYPVAHRLAFAWASRGFRGSSWIWRVARLMGPLRQGWHRRPDGLIFLLDLEDWTSLTTYEGTYERPLLQVLTRVVRPADLVVDVGANIGVTVAAMAVAQQRDGHVVAIEPSPRCVPVLNQLAGLLEVGVRIYAVAAGATRGTVEFCDSDLPAHKGLGHVLYPERKRSPVQPNAGISVPQVPTDQVWLSEGAPNVALLKVDVEGYEAQVLEGARGLLGSMEEGSIVAEVSPEFGSVQWAIDLVRAKSPDFHAFAVEERGNFRRSLCLVPVDVDSIPMRTRQWNLLLTTRTRSLSGFMTSPAR